MSFCTCPVCITTFVIFCSYYDEAVQIIDADIEEILQRSDQGAIEETL